MSDGIAQWERSLVARLAAGDDAALATAYDQYGALVYGVSLHLVGRDLALDVVQEVFAALWDHPDRFDESTGSLRTLLATLARRRCIDLLRRHGRRDAHDRRSHDVALVIAPNVDEAAMALIVGEQLRDALSRLPSHQREAIELAYFGGLTFREVAVRTGTAEGTATSRIRLGLQRLAHELRAGGEVELA